MNAPVHTLTAAERRRFNADEFMGLYESGIFGAKERLRLIGGEVYAMAPTGPEHATGLGRLIVVLGRTLGPRFEIATEPTLRFSEHDVVEPDVVVLPPGPRPRAPIAIAEIALIVEAAHSSLDDDLSVMAAIYAAAGISEYWVLDLAHQRLIILREPSSNGYGVRLEAGIGETAAALCAPDALVSIADLF